MSGSGRCTNCLHSVLSLLSLLAACVSISLLVACVSISLLAACVLSSNIYNNVHSNYSIDKLLTIMIVVYNNYNLF